ncbi:protein S100-P-like [Entelurus aequoreus]|uniref:protein S100-P-like n=1 Tax=Entelurus aequoreus TaxID=161455 RepID=UPI002B1DEC6A|nr:protein S100-P-like [Entelurus aequoreus]
MSSCQQAGMTKLESAIALLLETFNKYASAEGDKRTLNKAEVKTLLSQEMPKLLTKCAEDPGMVDKFLDKHGDGEVDFGKFIKFVADLACLCHSRCPGK